MTTDLIPTDSPFQFSTTGLIVSGQPTYDDWEAIWYYLKSRDVAMPWIIGDLLNFGEAAYGESIWQVTSEDDQRLVGHFKPGTLRNYKYVANRWPRERRIYDLAWSAYQATAALSPDKQDYIMSQAESSGQGRNAVRDKVNGTFPGDRLHEMEVEAEKKPDVFQLTAESPQVKDFKLLVKARKIETKKFTSPNAPPRN